MAGSIAILVVSWLIVIVELTWPVVVIVRRASKNLGRSAVFDSQSKSLIAESSSPCFRPFPRFASLGILPAIANAALHTYVHSLTTHTAGDPTGSACSISIPRSHFLPILRLLQVASLVC